MSNKRNAPGGFAASDYSSIHDDSPSSSGGSMHASKRGRADENGTVFLGPVPENHRASSSAVVDYGEVRGMGRLALASSGMSPPPSQDGSTNSSLTSTTRSRVTAADGRVVRQRQYADGMLLLNYKTYQWAR